MTGLHKSDFLGLGPHGPFMAPVWRDSVRVRQVAVFHVAKSGCDSEKGMIGYATSCRLKGLEYKTIVPGNRTLFLTRAPW